MPVLLSPLFEAIIGALLRHLVMALGVSVTLVTPDVVTQIAAGTIAFLMLCWSILQKVKADRKLKAAKGPNTSGSFVPPTLLMCVLVASLSVAGCANTLSNVETSLSAAEATALVYVKLPPCSKVVTAACSKYSTVQTIENARSAARIAIDAARKAGTEDATAVANIAAQAFIDIARSDLVQEAINAYMKGK